MVRWNNRVWVNGVTFGLKGKNHEQHFSHLLLAVNLGLEISYRQRLV